MTTIANPNPDPFARILTVGDAPATQTGAGGQWVNAWSVTGVSAVQKADVSSATEAWSAIKYTDVLSSVLAGGDIYHGDLGVSGQSSATSAVKQEIDGKEALRFNLTEAAQSATLSLSSFFANDDGTGYAESARIRLFDAAGNLVGESYAHADSLAGNQLVQLNSAVAFRSVEISAGALKADGSFAFGGYSNADGSFGVDSYTSGAKHGSDFLVHSISFALARPTAAADSYSFDEDAQPASFASVLANDKDPNNAPLTAVLETGAAHGTLTLNSDGTFTYLPQANYFGADSFSYRASNGKDLSDVTVVKLTINPVNDAPVAVNDSATTSEDQVVAGNVLDGSNGGRDTDVDGDTLSVSSAGTFTTALGAIVVLKANGDFTYDPTASSALQALQAGQNQVDGFDYTVSDGHGGTSKAHVAVTVQGHDEAQAGSLLLPSVAPGTHLSYYMHYTGSTEWVQIDSASVGAQSDATNLKGSGAVVGKPVPGDFQLTMGTGKALTDFTTLLLKGLHADDIDIEAYVNTGDGPKMVQQFKLTDAFLTAAHTTADADGATNNAFSLAYKTLGVSVSPLTAQGKPAAPSVIGWNIPASNLTGATPSSTADADLNHLATITPSNTDLEYYVHIDGVDGWFSLGSFSMGYDADTTYLKGTGASVGKPVPTAVTFGGLGINETLTTLLKNMTQGTAFRNIQVEAYNRSHEDSSNVKLVDEYFFNSAYATKLTTDADASASIVYKSFTHSHVAYDPRTGQVDPSDSSKLGYDLTAPTVPPPVPVVKADALAAPTAPSVGKYAFVSYYMHYAGSSDWVQIDSVSVGTQAASSYSKDGGAALGKPMPGDFQLTMGDGKALTDFTGKLLTGKSLADVDIEAYVNTAYGPQVVQQFKLTDAFVTSTHTTVGADGATSNAFSLAYKTLGESVSPLDDQGKPVTPSVIGWNIVASNLTGATPNPAADADLNHLATITPSDAGLQYYVHIDGVDGWFSLGSFSMGYSADTNYLKGTGASVGKPVPTAVTFGGLGINEMLTTLLKNMTQGTAIHNIQVEAYDLGGVNIGQQMVDEYFFNSAYATKLTTSTDAETSASIVYKSFTHSHVAYDPRTGLVDASDSNKLGYDVAAQTATVPVPVVKAEALNAPTAPSVGEHTSLSYYMHYAGSDEWVRIDGVSLGAQADSANLKGGPAVGKPVPGDFQLTMGTGEALTDFTTKLLAGKSLADVDIEAYVNTGDGLKVVQQFKLTDAFVTSVQTTAGADGATSNAFSLAYKTLGESVSPLDDQGRPVTPSVIGWNIPTNTLTGPTPSPAANADLNHLAPVTSSGAALDYYVHIDGVDGWVALQGLSMGYSADTTYLKGTGASVGKPVPTAVTLEGMGINQVLNALFKNQIVGASTTIQVEAYASHGGADGKPQLVDEYFFNHAYTTDSSTDAGGDVSVVYKSFSHSHLVYDDQTGRLDAAHSSGLSYDVATGAAIITGVPTPHADLFH